MLKSFPLPAVIIDLETTGANVSYDRIIEIGIIEIDEDGSTRKWSSLVNPGRDVPSFIEQLTGITNSLLSTAPRFEQIAKEVLLRIRGKRFIAHNVRFDYGFIRNEFSRLAYTFKASVICSLKLSRRLYPHESAHGLHAIIQRYNLNITKRHRALDDADAAYQFLLIAEQEHGVEKVSAILSHEKKSSTIPTALSHDVVASLPQQPGVYYFWGTNAELLYVGKGINIRKRVLSHFSSDHKNAKEMRLCQQISNVTWDITAGELSALILESCKIKQLKPIFNRKLRRPRVLYSILLQKNDKGWLTPAIVQLADTASNSSSLYGLFPSKNKAKETIRSISHEHKLCYYACDLEAIMQRPCTRYQLKKCSGLCVGTLPAAEHNDTITTALHSFALKVWPFSGAVALREIEHQHDNDPFLIVNNWQVLGSGRVQNSVAVITDKYDEPLDKDAYQYLVKAILGGSKKIHVQALLSLNYEHAVETM